MRRLAIVAVVVASIAGVAGVALLVGQWSSDDSTTATATAPLSTSTAVQRPHPRQNLATGRPTSDPVPVLMYHVVANPPAEARYPELYAHPHRSQSRSAGSPGTASTA